MNNELVIIIFMILMICFGCFGTILWYKTYFKEPKIKTLGSLKVDRSDPEKDKFLIELDIDPIEVLKYDKIMLKVVEIKKENAENK